MIPDSLSAAWTAIAPAMANHLWQSTLFTVAAAVLTLALRKNPARVRYRLWLIASIKFLIPFSLLISLSSHLIKPHIAVNVESDVYSAVEEVSLPFNQTAAAPAVAPSTQLTIKAAGRVPSWHEVVAAVWICGFVATLGLWLWRWRQAAACLRRAAPMPQGREVDALRQLEQAPGSHKALAIFLSTGPGEPGVFGIFRPVLLWPAGISKHLQDRHLEAILAHELAHVRRRDNLTAAMHMLVEAIFWFHPLVWWLGARLAEERERACDEEVLQLGKSAQVYAESILKTCEFCVGSPLACISGVTGADLKKRIVRIMTEADRAVRQLDYARKFLLCIAAVAGVASPIVFGLAHITQVRAQATSGSTNPSQGLAGTWQGLIHFNRDFRMVIKISKTDDGAYKAVAYNIDVGGEGFPANKITLDGSSVNMAFTAIGASYQGKLSPDGNTMTGNWTQGPNPLPLVLTRTAPDAEWPIPPPEVTMDPKAKPSFEVATVKPSPPNQPGKGFGFRGGRFTTRNTNLNDLIGFTYRLHPKQVVGAPAWFGTDLYDIEAKPDIAGIPNSEQMQAMLNNLLADRFQLKFHHEKRELSVYVISVGSGSLKVTRTTSPPDGRSAFSFRDLGDLTVRNQSMPDFATWMGTVLDKPVVDQTQLPGKYDFQLKWTPDESQFATFRGVGATIPPPSDDPKAPPNLYTAMQEQLGLKMGPAKIPADVIVIDHVEKPSEN
jgi:uncharacterized protein (TIGR03435 family)